MKKLWIFLGIIAILLLIGYLYNQGIIDTNWEWASVILAALAGPFAYLQKHFKVNFAKKNDVDIYVKHQQDLEREMEIMRQRYEMLIQQKELKIQELQAELEKLQQKIDDLELERQAVDQQVDNMSMDEKLDKFTEYFGT